ncbi:MSCRAMM family protein [Enterococcus sp. AZ177]|uniref:MSCRAMM family protein n=1 Tax=unclassified Enterococcus TaxID=2608891 RepID=UPI003D2F9CE6
MRKKMSLVLLISCLGVLCLNLFGNTKINAANETLDKESSVFQNVSLSKIEQQTGTVAKNSLKNGESINYDDVFQVKYHLSIPDEMKLTKNQTFTTNLPYLTPSSKEPVEVKDKDKNILGKWKMITDAKGSKRLSFQVSDFFVESKKHEADIEFTARLDSSITNKKQIVSFKFETKKESDLELTVLEVPFLDGSTEKVNTKIPEKSIVKGDEKTRSKRATVVSPRTKNATVENKAATYSIKVYTIDKEDHSIPVNGVIALFSYDNLSEAIRIETTVNGQLTFTDLPAGRYRVAAGASQSAGYYARVGVANYHEFIVPSTNQTATVEYLRGWGSVRLTKQDETTGAVLPGAEFKLVKNNPDNSIEVVKEGIVSTNKGIVQVDQLFVGNYSFIETKAPEGYILDSTPIVVSLKHEILVYPDPKSKPLWTPESKKTKTNKKADITMSSSTVPTNLNFGKTKIQNSRNETFTATEYGFPTVGKVVIDDTRSNGGWTLKVKQNSDFVATDGSPLVNTTLDVAIGRVTNTASNLPSYIRQVVSLKSGVENSIAIAKTTEGTGKTTIPLDKFSLTVPKETTKKISQYNSSLTWTLSDVPQ